MIYNFFFFFLRKCDLQFWTYVSLIILFWFNHQWNNNFSGPLKTKVPYTCIPFNLVQSSMKPFNSLQQKKKKKWNLLILIGSELAGFGRLVQLLNRLRTVQFFRWRFFILRNLCWRLKQRNCASYYYLNICQFQADLFGLL